MNKTSLGTKSLAGFLLCAAAACSGGGDESPIPQAAFSVSDTTGTAPLTVEFTDNSTGLIDAWFWEFGDGSTATEQNPTHTFTGAGNFSVALNVSGPEGSDVLVQTDLVRITESAPDPLFAAQWHHENSGQNGGVPGEDARTPEAWALGFDGSGARIAIVDNGLQLSHPDLLGNTVPDGSRSYTGNGTDPGLGDHGTACAGVAAGIGENGIGGLGAAPSAELIGLGLLVNNTIANQVDAMTFDNANVVVSSNSWGPPDTLGVLADSPAAWRSAVEDGITFGRGGLGTVYTWAAGNGALSGGNLVDNSNYDGYANFYGVIAVAAVGDRGRQAFYSEDGANLWIAAPSEGNSGQAITTTDLLGSAGFNNGSDNSDYQDLAYTNTFNGTSSSTPLISGVIGLMAEANPNLTWSDVRVILAQSARRNDPGDPDWTTNGAGFNINHAYGFGVVDARAAVELAQTWTSLAPLTSESTATISIDEPITDNDPTPVTALINVEGSAINQLEYVHVHVDIPDHDFWPDLEIEITSPSGTVSRLASPHAAVTSSPNLVLPRMNDWRFGVTRCLGEPVNGTWTLSVRDLVSGLTGTVESVRFEFYGRP